MKLKLNKNLSLPWTPQGRESVWKPPNSLAKRICPHVKLTRSHFVAQLYQFFDLADRATVTGYITTVINTSTRLHLRESKSR